MAAIPDGGVKMKARVQDRQCASNVTAWWQNGPWVVVVVEVREGVQADAVRQGTDPSFLRKE